MFEHVVNSVYIPSDDVISHKLDVFGGQFYDISSEVCRQRGSFLWRSKAQRHGTDRAVTYLPDHKSLTATLIF